MMNLPKMMYIYPALYPLSKVKMAVALVSKWSTNYSGGARGRIRKFHDDK